MSARTGRWGFFNPTRVTFGLGSLDELPGLVAGRTLLVTSPGSTRRGLTERVAKLIGDANVMVHDEVETSPTVERLDASIEQLRGLQIGTVVAVGGGSAIDTGKVVSLALTNPGLGVRALIASALDVPNAPVPVVAVPTTAGTGSEVTPFATVWSRTAPHKLSLASEAILPRAALVDPELTLTLDLEWEQTLRSGLDALVQCVEAICNRNATPLTDVLAERGAVAASRALPALRRQPDDPCARAEMAEAALLSGLAISQTRTALAHSLSYPITARLGLPHGLACAVVMPAVLEFNAVADDGRMSRLARLLEVEDGNALAVRLLDLYRELGVADAVSAHVPDLRAIEPLAPEMLSPGRADNNPRPVDPLAVETILERTVELMQVEVSA